MNARIMEDIIEEIIMCFRRIKLEKPRIHMIPNEVSANLCADVIAALGARPIMATSIHEVETITAHARALVINMGQLTDNKLESIHTSLKAAESNGIPVVLDPVGAGASSYRLEATLDILEMGWKGIIKLNQSEYQAIGQRCLTYTGVDTDPTIEVEVVGQARNGSGSIGDQRTVCMTGKIDQIWNSREHINVHHYETRLPQIVGSGCALGALTGVYQSVAIDAKLAGVAASLTMAIVSKQAESCSKGYMDYKMNLIDGLYVLKEEDFITYGLELLERVM